MDHSLGEMRKRVQCCEFSLRLQPPTVGHQPEQLRFYAFGELMPSVCPVLWEHCSRCRIGACSVQSRQQRDVLCRHRFGHSFIVECVVLEGLPGDPGEH